MDLLVHPGHVRELSSTSLKARDVHHGTKLNWDFHAIIRLWFMRKTVNSIQLMVWSGERAALTYYRKWNGSILLSEWRASHKNSCILVSVFHHSFTLFHLVLSHAASSSVCTTALCLIPHSLLFLSPCSYRWSQESPETSNICVEMWMLKFKISQEVRENSSRQCFPSYIVHRQGLSMRGIQGAHPAFRHKGRMSKAICPAAKNHGDYIQVLGSGTVAVTLGTRDTTFQALLLSPGLILGWWPHAGFECAFCTLLRQAVVSLSIASPASWSHQSSLLLFTSRLVCYPYSCVTVNRCPEVLTCVP